MFYSSFRCSRNSTLTKLSRRLFTTLRFGRTQQNQKQQQQQHPHQQSLRKYAKEVEKGEIFNTPRPPKDPPDDYKPTSFNHKAFEAPDFLPCSIFRQFSSPEEKLGPSAAKNAKYQNPEYYAYHRFTFVEIQKNVLELRRQRICNDNAQCIYDYESDDEADKSKADDEDDKKKADCDVGKDKTSGSEKEKKSKDKKSPPSGIKK